jgi:two-component system, OmpR family, alkaline phosphatase synthesis response regulator PhoP
VVREGKPVSLAAKELQLLRYLIDNRERIVPREEIMQRVWEYSTEASSRTIDTHVAWLRQKLEENPQTPRFIQTVRGKGYRFSP